MEDESIGGENGGKRLMVEKKFKITSIHARLKSEKESTCTRKQRNKYERGRGDEQTSEGKRERRACIVAKGHDTQVHCTAASSSSSLSTSSPVDHRNRTGVVIDDG